MIPIYCKQTLQPPATIKNELISKLYYTIFSDVLGDWMELKELYEDQLKSITLFILIISCRCQYMQESCGSCVLHEGG